MPLRWLALLLLPLLLTWQGCASPPGSVYVPATEEGISSANVDSHDYQLVVEKMVSSMLKQGLKPAAGKPPVIALGNIFNHTPYDLETRMIGEDIRVKALKGLARFSTATDFKKKGGESGDLFKQLEFQNESGHVDLATAKQYGQLVGADYVLFGNIYSLERASPDLTEANLKFVLTLTEVQTGLAVWSDTKLIRKNIPKRSSLLGFGSALFEHTSPATTTFVRPNEDALAVGRSKCALSKDAQHYLKVLQVSDYQSRQSVIIIEEPHFSVEGHVGLYKGLDVFFRDNPALVTKTIFLAEGLPANQALSAQPLIQVNNDPGEELIRKVLGTFLIPGYVAYEWKRQKGIPMVGVEDPELYGVSRRLWTELQAGERNPEKAALWHQSVVARNRSIAGVLIEQARKYENPILFVGGLHLQRQPEADYRRATQSGSASGLDVQGNLGIMDYLKAARIGYTFLVPIPSRAESSQEIARNVSNYVELFKAQQRGDYSAYIQRLVSETRSGFGVTVSASPEAAATFVAASSRGGDDNDDPKKDKNKGGNKADDASGAWEDPNKLQGHFDKHGGDFNAKTPSEYARKAWEFLKQAGKFLKKIDADGNIRVYDPETNTFGSYTKDGKARTFFKPAPKSATNPNGYDPSDCSSPLDYWKKQKGN